MKRIAIIGSGEFQTPLILKAKELGYVTYVFSKKNNTIGEEVADKFYDIDIFDKDKILEICKENKIDGITTIASEVTTHTLTYVAERLGLISNSSECVKMATNKYKMREAFKKSGIYTPQYCLVEENEDIESKIINFKYPLIVKPTDRAGSRGVTKAKDYKELIQAINIAVEASFNKQVIVEEYIEGKEYSCECISNNGNHNRLVFTKKYTTGEPNFIETGHIQPMNFEGNEKIIEDTIFKALDSLRIKYGASHSEFKITPQNEVAIIEIGARMAGDCIGSDLVELSTGIDYVKLVIDVAMGNELDIKPIKETYICAIKFICSEEDVETLKFIENNNKDMLVKKSEEIVENIANITDSSTRGGWYILKTDETSKLEKYFKE